MNEQMKTFIRHENEFTITRVGNTFVDKAVVDGVAFEMKLPINEEVEWKEQEENPIFHVKVSPSNIKIAYHPYDVCCVVYIQVRNPIFHTCIMVNNGWPR